MADLLAINGTIMGGVPISGGQGGGHTIEDASGTKLTQRDVMQVLDGLEAVDDSTNQKTKIKMNLPIVSSADWNAMTEQEKTAYKASHYRFGVEVPDTEGVINAEYMKLLWENPNTTQVFASQTVTLLSADYDFLLIISSQSRSANKALSTIGKKGQNIAIAFATTQSSGNTTYICTRDATRNNDTSYTFTDAYGQTSTGARATDNGALIPIAIYGIKASFQFKVNAIATDLSTRADHCFLSDDETSVEDKLTANNIGSAIDITSYNSESNKYTCPSDGYVRTYAYNSVNWVVKYYSADNNNLTSSNTYAPSGIEISNMVFVRKGMKVYTTKAGTGSGAISFVPLIN